MDAKPHRPRALRVHDENQPLSAVGLPTGKTLHSRTKSTPALSVLVQGGAGKAAAVAAATAAAVNKQVLGEVNANKKVTRSAKDDSEIGKASPGKISLKDVEKPAVAAAFARPASRPLAPKTTAHNIQPATLKSAATSQASMPEPDAAKKIAIKKSTKVLRDAQTDSQSDTSAKPIAQSAPMQQSSILAPIPISAPVTRTAQQTLLAVSAVEPPFPEGVAIEHHEVQNVPLRDEGAARNTQIRNVVSGVQGSSTSVPQDHVSFASYAGPVTTQSHYTQMPYVANGYSVSSADDRYLLSTSLPQHYYDAVDNHYGYDDGYTTARSFGLPGDNTATIVVPSLTESVARELKKAKIFVEETRPVDDIEDEKWDTSMVAEYSEEIFEYMREKETQMAPNPHYMDEQQEIQWSMRGVLMDWVIQVHQRFNLLPETLFLTANYIDRFLSAKVVSLGKLQLVGATAIFIAAKYEEVQCPTISEIIYMVDGGYSADELLKAERFMLSMLRFELGWPGPMSFLRRISKADDYDLETRTLAKYFLEITLMDERFLACTPSALAAAAHCMARLMLYGTTWSQAHVYYSNYTFLQLKSMLVTMLDCCENPRKHHNAVYEKYTDKRYKRASTFVQSRMAEGFRLQFVVGGTAASGAACNEVTGGYLQ